MKFIFLSLESVYVLELNQFAGSKTFDSRFPCKSRHELNLLCHHRGGYMAFLLHPLMTTHPSQTLFTSRFLGYLWPGHKTEILPISRFNPKLSVLTLNSTYWCNAALLLYTRLTQTCCLDTFRSCTHLLQHAKHITLTAHRTLTQSCITAFKI